jgi:hypothetical protein
MGEPAAHKGDRAMSVSDTALGFKLSTTRARITPRAGLALVRRMAQRLGVSADLGRALGRLKRRRRGLSPAEQALDWVMMLVAGGQCGADLRLLRADRGTIDLLGHAGMAPRTGREFLARFDWPALDELSRTVGRCAARTAAEAGVTTATLDVDATFVEAHKAGARHSYKGAPGYMPMLGSWAETQSCLAGEFRDGNVSPSTGALPFLVRLVRRLPAGLERVRLRSDSAWYQARVFDWCAARGVEFAVTDVQTEAVVKAIEAIAPGQWQPFSAGAPDEQIAETVHAVEGGRQAYRLVVVRHPWRQLEVFKGLWQYQAVITNMAWSAERLILWHRERATSENGSTELAEVWIKELKGGFGLDRLPSGRFESNAAYFELALLAYNLVVALRRVALPPSFWTATIKTVRFHFIHIAALVVRHARRLVVKLAEGYRHLGVFRRAGAHIAASRSTRCTSGRPCCRASSSSRPRGCWAPRR